MSNQKPPTPKETAVGQRVAWDRLWGLLLSPITDVAQPSQVETNDESKQALNRLTPNEGQSDPSGEAIH